MSALGSLEVALVLGMRHALEVDHVAALGTLIERDARPRQLTALATRWALGHGLILSGIGLSLVAVGLRLPSAFERSAELAVAALRLLLGVRRLWARRFEPAQPERDAFAVGLMHGLAGSGPLALLAVSTLDSKPFALLYLVLVSIGALLGMVAIALAFSLPLAPLTARAHTGRALELLAGGASVAAGLHIAFELLR
jgi:high-affinity nickel-transport protein